ncbi:radical SAM protein [Dehalobacter restrictus]|uniref:radical SAM protein n=1 Tax=Dehalobacter restrictus TaxID=55583 RepID=UPI00338E5DBB
MPKFRLYYELTSECNLRCSYCFEKEYPSNALSFEDVCRFHTRVSGIVSDIVITGGEPFLHPEIYQAIEWFSSATPVTVTTNGTHVDSSRIIDLLSKYPNFHLQISLDSLSSEIMGQLRGKHTLAKILKLIEICRAFSAQLGISATVTKANLNCVPELISFARETGISIYFPALIPSGGLAANWYKLMPSVNEYIEFEDFLLSKIANDAQNLIASNKVDRILSRYFISDDEVRAIKIDARGNVIACPASDSSCSDTVITTIDEVESESILLALLAKTPGCTSANLLSASCCHCKYEAMCRGEFCGNCIYMKSQNRPILEYICQSYFHHFENIAKMEEQHEGAT